MGPVLARSAANREIQPTFGAPAGAQSSCRLAPRRDITPRGDTTRYDITPRGDATFPTSRVRSPVSPLGVMPLGARKPQNRPHLNV
jgi:hypothetical protein